MKFTDTQFIFLVHCMQILNIGSHAYDSTPYKKKCHIRRFRDDPDPTMRQFDYFCYLINNQFYVDSDKIILSEIVQAYKEEIVYLVNYELFKNRLLYTASNHYLASLTDKTYERFDHIMQHNEKLKHSYVTGFKI